MNRCIRDIRQGIKKTPFYLTSLWFFYLLCEYMKSCLFFMVILSHYYISSIIVTSFMVFSSQLNTQNFKLKTKMQSHLIRMHDSVIIKLQQAINQWLRYFLERHFLSRKGKLFTLLLLV